MNIFLSKFSQDPFKYEKKNSLGKPEMAFKTYWLFPASEELITIRMAEQMETVGLISWEGRLLNPFQTKHVEFQVVDSSIC
jgi:hypothetical protein